MEGGEKDATEADSNQGLLDRLIEDHGLNEGLSAHERDAGLRLVSRLQSCRAKRRYPNKRERQFILQQIRSDLWLLKKGHRNNHTGFLDMLESLEESIDLDFDSIKKGYFPDG